MSARKPKPVPHFPVMDGAEQAPRSDQIAGIVQRVWCESRVYSEDAEALLHELLKLEKCAVDDEEFTALLRMAGGEVRPPAVIARPGEAVHRPRTLPERIYEDVQEFERGR